MKVLKVKLKQHTPILHFQHGERGSTLRATEVKPKLDKFLLSREKGLKPISPDCPSLDYHMRIVAKGEKKEYLVAARLGKRSMDEIIRKDSRKKINIIPVSPYFAQEKENKVVVNSLSSWNAIPKKGVMYDDIYMYLWGDSVVIDALERNIDVFFLTENFGTRQNKGFGSFTVDNISETSTTLADSPKKRTVDDILRNNFDFCYASKKKYYSQEEIFEAVTSTYARLKAGGRKVKSELFNYFQKKNIIWEKEHFKNECYSKFYGVCESGKYKSDVNNNNKYSFVRALLGLPNQYEFRNSKLTIKVDGHDIERFKSPILFKVIDGKIYIVGKSVNPVIFDKSFDFSVTVENDPKWKNRSIKSLKTPRDFNLRDFMKAAMKNDRNFIGIKI